jgi:hypothetical protein
VAAVAIAQRAGKFIVVVSLQRYAFRQLQLKLIGRSLLGVL